MAWQDTKVVFLTSTLTSLTSTTGICRSGRDGSSRDVPHLEGIIALYNRHMGGVDKADQLRGYYHIQKISRKFYM